MRYYTEQHQYYCGVDLHARTMYLCIVNQVDEIVYHRTLKYKSTQQGVAERFNDESARKTVEVDLELIACYDTIIRKLEWHLVRSAKAHDPTA